MSLAILCAAALGASGAQANWVRETLAIDRAQFAVDHDLRMLPDGTAAFFAKLDNSSSSLRLFRRATGGTSTPGPAFSSTIANPDRLALSQPDANGNMLLYRDGNRDGSTLLTPTSNLGALSLTPHNQITALSMSQSGAAAAIVAGGSQAYVSFRPAGVGSTFDTPRELDRAGNQRSYATGITLDPDGGVFVIYETEQDAGLFQAYAPPGEDFGAPQLLPVPEESIEYSGMEGHYAQSANGHVIFTWDEFQKTGPNLTVRSYAAIRRPGGMLGAKILLSDVGENSGRSVSSNSQGITDDGSAYVALLSGTPVTGCEHNWDGNAGGTLVILAPGGNVWRRIEGEKTWPKRTTFGPIVTAGNMVAVGRYDSLDNGARCLETNSTSSIAIYRGQNASLGALEPIAQEEITDESNKNTVHFGGLAINAVGQVSALSQEPVGTDIHYYLNTREQPFGEDAKPPEPPAPILTRPGKIKFSGKVLKATRNRIALPATCVSVGPGDKVACTVNANITSAHEAVWRARSSVSSASASAKSKSGKKKAAKKGKARGKKGKKRQVSLGKAKTRIAPGKTKKVIIKLNGKAKKALKKRKVIPVTLKVTITKKGAKPLVITRKMKLKSSPAKKARGKAKKRGKAVKKARAKGSSVMFASSSAVLATSSAAKSKPKIGLVKAKPVKVVPIEINRYAYTDRVELSCRGKSTPLMPGWSSPGGSVGSAYIGTYLDKTELGLMMIAPARTGTFKGWVTCLNRDLKTKYKSGKSAGEKVSRASCAKNQVAIGMPVRNAPYYDKNVYSRPIGTNGWETNEGIYAIAQVLCLPKSSMRALKLVKRSVPFKAGTRTTKVSAACRGGRSPISWGFESDAMPDNAWRGASNPVGAPLISKAARQGKKGWSLTFFTPDGNPAVKTGRVAIHLTCAKPR